MIVALDPGLKGGAAMRDEAGQLVVLPLSLYLLQPTRATHVVEEMLPVPGRSVQSTMTTAKNWGAMMSTVSRCGPTVTVHPRTWQAALGLSAGKGEAKAAHKRRIQAAMQRCYGRDVPLDLADAAAILYWQEQREARCVKGAA